MFKVSTNKCYNEWFKSIEFFWMFCSNINQKGMQDYFDIPKWRTFIWSAKTLLKTWNIVLVFAPTSPIFLSKSLERNFVINKINLIVFINTSIIRQNPRF